MAVRGLTGSVSGLTLRRMGIFKKDAVSIYGTQQALADALGISRSAVAMWADNKPIPAEHALRLRYELKPGAFNKNGQFKAAKKAA